MNKRIPLLLIGVIALTGCAKTELLYDEFAYNYTDFDKNYYEEWEGIENLSLENTNSIAKTPNFSMDPGEVTIGSEKIEGYVWEDKVNNDKHNEFGYNHNLSKIEKKFSYGITSKLFDGRVRCEGKFQKSRIQLDKTGFAMYFPKSLVSAKYLGFACRGGSNLPDNEFSHDDLNVDFSWSFYIHLESGLYNKVVYTLNDVKIPVDNGGNTTFVNFVPYIGDNFEELYGAVAMSFEWSADDPRLDAHNLSDNHKDENKSHLALMLYEIFIGDSTWY